MTVNINACFVVFPSFIKSNWMKSKKYHRIYNNKIKQLLHHSTISKWFLINNKYPNYIRFISEPVTPETYPSTNSHWHFWTRVRHLHKWRLILAMFWLVLIGLPILFRLYNWTCLKKEIKSVYLTLQSKVLARKAW